MTFQAVVVSITLHIFLQIVKGYFFFLHFKEHFANTSSH